MKDNALGERRVFGIDLSEVNVQAADTDGGVVKMGTASVPVVSDVADMKLWSLYGDNGATSGDNRLMYMRFYLTGAGGGGEALRAFTTVNDVAAGTAHGIHASLSFGTTGTVTGLGVAMRATLHVPNDATQAGTVAAVQAEIWSDGATSDPAGSLLSAIRIVNDGNATGMADVDDDAAALDLVGWTDATGNLLFGHTFRIRTAGTSRYVVMSDTENRLDLSTINVSSGNTDGGVIKIGTSGSPVTEDTANMKFVSMYFDDGATSGEAVGIYDRLYVTGAGGEGIALRAFCSVTDVAAGNARGAHISLSFGSSGSVTGLGTALETTLHIPTTAGLAGTVSSIKAAINSDGANSDPVGARLSVFNVVNQGNATGMADVDDDAALFDFQGWGDATGNMVYTHSITVGATAAGSLKIRTMNGTIGYLYWYAAEGS